MDIQPAKSLLSWVIEMVKIAKEAGQKCTLNKPLYCPKNGEHLNSCFPKYTKALYYICSFNGHRFSFLKSVIEVILPQRINNVKKLQEILGEMRGMHITLCWALVLSLALMKLEKPPLKIINRC